MSDFDPFVAEWITYAKSPQYSLVEKCLKLAQTLEFPDLDLNHYIQKLNFMGEELRNSVSDVKNPTYLISMLNEYMFDNLGFHGDSDDYYNPRNNFLNVVIDKQSGIPITLSIIYSQLGTHIGLDLRPVGFPGHFLVKYSEEMILDPFNGGILLDVEDLQEILDTTYGSGIQFSPDYLNEIEPEKILIRITNNLKNSYMQSFNYKMAMHCINMVLGLAPDSPEEIRDKGIIQSRLLQNESAIQSLEQYLELAPEANDVDYVLDLIRSIKEKANQ
ncbi:MAG: transglutaminase family protein [Thaumarchaeota archaeon]|nr:transglutaminase family protein [Nitrososphaerota archaeon]MDE1866755.1 transglutaminase family protein [Nitrososphaerota archaeon]